MVESLQRIADWCLRYARDEDRRGGLPPIPSSNSVASEFAESPDEWVYMQTAARLHSSCL